MHIFAFASLMFLVGCFCGIQFAAISVCIAIINVFFVITIKALIFGLKKTENLYAFLVLTIFCCGAGMGMYHDYKTFSKVYPMYGTDITLNGKVIETKGKNFVISTEYGNITVYNDIFMNVKKGNTVTVTGDLSGYEKSQYRGGFDRRLYNALYGNVGYITCDKCVINGYSSDYTVWDTGERIRGKIEDTIMSADVSDRSKGLVAALLTGDTKNISCDVKENFRITGISHVTAVSGLHVGIFLSFFILFSRGMSKNKIVHFLFILVLVVMYTILIGERASVLRAGIMSVCGYAMFAMRKRSDSLMNLMMAGILICLVNPYYITSAGFQMSFLATLGIVLFAEYFKHQLIAVPVIVTLFMLPITLYYYNMVSLTTVIVNVAVVSFIPFIIMTGYIGCFIPPFLYISYAIAEFVIIVAEFFASMNFLHFTLPSTNVRQLIMYLLLICGTYFYFGKKNIGNALLMLMLVCIIFITGLFGIHNDEKFVSVKFINSGNYNMQHITTENGYEIFVDCADFTADYAIKNNVDDIYAVIVTSGYSTRWEGIGSLCSAKNVRYVLLPETMKDKNLKLEKCEILYYNQYDYVFSVDDVKFKFTEIDGERCLIEEMKGSTIAIPFDKTVSELSGYTILCVPDGCEDVALTLGSDATYCYIHATYGYEYYDYERKYITARDGLVNIIFTENAEPVIGTY